MDGLKLLREFRELQRRVRTLEEMHPVVSNRSRNRRHIHPTHGLDLKELTG